jgi:hypothetical protein
VQDIKIENNNIVYKLARYKTPEGKYIIGKLPSEVAGCHYGVVLRAYILDLYYELRATQNTILQQLRNFGVLISAGQLNDLIIGKHDIFHEEKSDILDSGLKNSNYIGTDDTGARHKGKNWYCNSIGNHLFTCFNSTPSKSRINFLELLRNNRIDYTINQDAILYCEHMGLTKGVIEILKNNSGNFKNKTDFVAYLAKFGIKSESHIKTITEAGLLATVIDAGINPEIVIMSDEAGQFQIAIFLNILCWVHSERHVNKLSGYTPENVVLLDKTQDEIWDYYKKLKAYKESPTPEDKVSLEQEFDLIFSQNTGFASLDKILHKIYKNKKQMLLVLEKPYLPLHNNLRENDIRDYVIRRKISGTTRSDEGRKAIDTFLSIKKTCLKLKINFWDYLIDRLSGANQIPRLADLIAQRSVRVAPG